MRQSPSSVLPPTGGHPPGTPRKGRATQVPNVRPLTERVAGWSTRHRKTTVFGWLALVAIVFVAGQLIGTKNVPSNDPGQSGVAERVLQRLNDNGPPPAEDVLIQARSAASNRPELRQATQQVVTALRELPRSTATDIRSPLSRGGASLISADGRSVLVTFNVTGGNEDQAVLPALRAVAAVQAAHPGLRIAEAGGASEDRVVNGQLSRDFRKAESTSLPITLILLICVFGALIAAGIPLLLAGTAVITAISLCSVIGQWLPTGQSTSEVVLIIGMAVGIDYTLFYLRREREERSKGLSTSEALRIAAGTSGRAIVISGLTVMIALAGLFLTGYPVFTGIGIGTIAVVGVTVVGSLTFLPALLSWLGPWADRGRVPFLGRRRSDPSRLWSALVRRVVRRPAAWGAVAAIAMLALAAPALGMRLGSPPDGGFASSLPVVQTANRIQAAFPATPSPAQVVVTGPSLGSRELASAVTALQRSASASGMIRKPVTASAIAGGRALVVSVPLQGNGTDSRSDAALIDLRDRVLPATLGKVSGVSYAVTGPTANNYDDIAALHSRTPLVLAVVAAAGVRAPAAGVRLGDDPAGFDRAEPAVCRRGIRSGHADLPGRPAAKRAGLHELRCGRVLGATVHVRVPVRHEHGLPRLHPEPDPGAAASGRLDQGRGGRRHLEQCRGGHERRGNHGGRLLHPGDLVDHPAQDAGRWPGRCGADRRHRCPRDPRAGRASAPRRARLVPAPLAGVAARPARLSLRPRGPSPCAVRRLRES